MGFWSILGYGLLLIIIGLALAFIVGSAYYWFTKKVVERRYNHGKRTNSTRITSNSGVLQESNTIQSRRLLPYTKNTFIGGTERFDKRSFEPPLI